MKTLTVTDVEIQLLDNLRDLSWELSQKQLDCSEEQAEVLLRKYQEFEQEILMLLYPETRAKDDDKLKNERQYRKARVLC